MEAKVPDDLKLDRLAHAAASAQHGQRSLEHVSYLDGWRGLAITLVLQEHFLNFKAFDSGRLGVDVFFVLSGLLMGNILFGKRTPLKTFYKRRASRVLPAFFLYVSLTFGVAYVAGYKISALKVIATLTFLRTYIPAHPTIWQSSLPIGHLWSLNVEEHGYVVMSLLTLVAFFRSREWIPLFVIAVASIAMQLIYINHIQPPDFELRTECAITHLALSAGYSRIAHRVRPWVKGWQPFVAFILVCCAYTRLAPWWAGQIIAPFLLAFVVNHLSETWKFIRSALSHPALRLVGIWSFSLYLWQQPFYTYQASFPPGVAFCLAVLISLLSFYFVENPIRAYLNRKW